MRLVEVVERRGFSRRANDLRPRSQDTFACSSPTVLLALDALRQRPSPPRRVVMLAFGPGLTLYGTLLETSTVTA